MTSATLGLDADDFSALLSILQRHIPHEEVWAFGSRVRGTHRPFSDLDLVVVKDQSLDAQTRAELQYELSESDLSVKVDVVEWSRADPAFRDVILKNHQVVKPKSI